MIQSEFRFTLDTHAAASQVSLGVKKGETGRRLRIHLTEAGYPYHIPDNCYAVFAATKPDGKKIFNDCVIDDCEIIYDMTEQTVAAAGLMVCAINLYGVENDLLISASFGIIVYCPPVDQGDLESTSEYKALAALIAEAEALKEGMEEGGGPGGYYVPIVDQPTENTVQFSWMASGEGLPAVPPAVVELPGGGNDSGQNANGLTADERSTLIAIVNAIGTFNVSNGQELMDAFNEAWGNSDSGDTGGDSGDGDDSGSGEDSGGSGDESGSTDTTETPLGVAWTEGVLINKGSETANAAWVSSDFVDVSGKTEIRIYNDTGKLFTFWGSYYDDTHTYIDGSGFNGAYVQGTDTYPSPLVRTIPDGAAYVRLTTSIRVGSDSAGYFRYDELTYELV